MEGVKVVLTALESTLEYVKVLEDGWKGEKEDNVKLKQGLTDLKSQLLDSGHSVDSILIISIITLLKK